MKLILEQEDISTLIILFAQEFRPHFVYIDKNTRFHGEMYKFDDAEWNHYWDAVSPFSSDYIPIGYVWDRL